jgi:hypothetical protein
MERKRESGDKGTRHSMNGDGENRKMRHRQRHETKAQEMSKRK